MGGIFIRGGDVLGPAGLTRVPLRLTNGRTGGPAPRDASDLIIDAAGLLVLPGIVDIHGDAFERQMMPRPGVDFPVDLALADSDRQAISNGITTVFHATTWSWEPGLRGAETARRLASAIAEMRPRLSADTRLHLRHEIFNLDAEDEVASWLADGRAGLLAFNDHVASIVAKLDKPAKIAPFLDRTGLDAAAFRALALGVAARAGEVPASVARLAAIARQYGVPTLSHDDNSPAMRRTMRELGVVIAEFPVNEETARDASGSGDDIVFGAPNVVRGGSHTGWTKAADMIAKGYGSILASDYYYPAPLLAAFRLADDNVLPFPAAWAMVSRTPARAAGLRDRGELTEGARADVILVDAGDRTRPQVVVVIVAGRIVYLRDAARVRAPAAIEPIFA